MIIFQQIKQFTQSMQAVLIWPGTDLDMILFPSSTNQIALVDMTLTITQLNRWNKATIKSENWTIRKLIDCAPGHFGRCPETSVSQM